MELQPGYRVYIHQAFLRANQSYPVWKKKKI